MQRLTALALAVRIGIALVTRTFFQPDEFFQSLEVAHRLVFGYGHLTWEWLSPQPIRSIIYPALNAPIYWSLKAVALDDTYLLIWGPKILHGALAACTDIWLCALTKKVLGRKYVTTVLWLSLTSIFHGLSLSRSISNSLETSLTIIALYYFPWDHTVIPRRDEIWKMFIYAGLSCAVRPTNAVIWVFMIAALFWRLRHRRESLAMVILSGIATGSIVILAITALDSAYYGKAIFTPLNFLRTNLSAVSLFYGPSPWHYYLTQAIPILCTTTLPFVLQGIRLAARSQTASLKTILGLLAWTIAVYSLAGHKEWRFIHPLLPLMHVLASKAVLDAQPKSRTLSFVNRHYRWLAFLGIPAIIYVSIFHSRAQIDVVHYLKRLPPGEVYSIGFLMPCHSTPWQSYLHMPDLADSGRLWALGCEPPLSGQDVNLYKDQTDIFYESPMAYLRTRFPARVNTDFPPSLAPCTPPGVTITGKVNWQHEWPQYMVMFGALLDRDIRNILAARGYREVWKSESGWEGDRRRQGGVRVWRFQPVLDQ